MNTELNNTPCLNDIVLVSTVVSLDSVSSETKRAKIEGDLAAQGCMMISISTWLQRGLHMADLGSGDPAAITVVTSGACANFLQEGVIHEDQCRSGQIRSIQMPFGPIMPKNCSDSRSDRSRSVLVQS